MDDDDDEGRSPGSVVDAATSQISEDESTNDNDENEPENENDNEAEMDQDNDGGNDNDEDEGDMDIDAEGEADGDQDNEQLSSPSTPKPSSQRQLTSSPIERIRKREPPQLQDKADTCSSYDIVPVLAAPHATSVNAITATMDMRWVFTGGSDGYIRKFDHFAGMNGKVPLTVAQKHPFVDSVTKAGVLLSYWENEEPVDDFATPVKHSAIAPKISSVYCLAAHSDGLWLLSGLESGGINLQTVRHEEGKVLHVLKKHTSAVSVLCLTNDERSVLSGSWDRQVYEWDLDTGEISRSYVNHTGQLSSICLRPTSSVPLFPAPSPPRIESTPTFNHDRRRSSLGSNNDLESLFGDESPNGNLANGLMDPVIETEHPASTPEPATEEPPAEKHSCTNVFLTSSIDGTISLWDRRQDRMIARLELGHKGTPPWCMSACWSTNGDFIYAGRRNGTVDEYSMHKPTSVPTRTFRFPGNSGQVTSVHAMPNGRNLICASYDNLRLYDLVSDHKHGVPPFLIIPGHQSGTIASIYVDPSCRFMLTAGGNRGWGGATTEVVMGYDVNVIT